VKRLQPYTPPPVYPKPSTTWHIDEWGKKNGYLSTLMQSGDHKLIAVLRTISGAQIIRGDQKTVEERWSYETTEAALAAFARWVEEWTPDNEPEGWVRHQPSNRRRGINTFGRGVEYVEE
jgi:hypothetical protein